MAVGHEPSCRSFFFGRVDDPHRAVDLIPVRVRVETNGPRSRSLLAGDSACGLPAPVKSAASRLQQKALVRLILKVNWNEPVRRRTRPCSVLGSFWKPRGEGPPRPPLWLSEFVESPLVHRDPLPRAEVNAPRRAGLVEAPPATPTQTRRRPIIGLIDQL